MEKKNIDRDKDRNSRKRKKKKKRKMIDLQIELFWIYFWENLTDRSVRDVNETSNNVAHLIFVTK